MNFMDSMTDKSTEIDFNMAVTENGAVGYATTGKALVDLNFAVGSMRSMSDTKIAAEFIKAYQENPDAALRWLFFARDCREGLGERKLFRACMKWLAQSHTEVCRCLIPLVGEYGRFDDLLCLFRIKDLKTDTAAYIKQKLDEDTAAMNEQKSVSMLAKWLPRLHCASEQTNREAKELCIAMGMTQKEYRTALSSLCSYANVIEQKMSNGKWAEINYEAVPSKANLRYKDAFNRHDAARREEFLEAVNKGEAKINADVLTPSEIYAKYVDAGDYYRVSNGIEIDETIEALWKNLPDTVNGGRGVMVICDGSGSMSWGSVGNTKLKALDVSNSMAIYFAERSVGEFKDRYVTFSSRPEIVDLRGLTTLRDKCLAAESHTDCSNTDIERTFKLILDTAVQNHMKQEELPATLLIISDMEFDAATAGDCDEALFTHIGKQFADAGYEMPRIAFWNVCSRTHTIPLTENKQGVILVGGFSPQICKMVMSGAMDPYSCLMDAINSKRYDAVSEVVKGLL